MAIGRNPYLSSTSSDAVVFVKNFTGVYCFGFNGKESDNSTSADSYDFGARILDARIGRWLSVDARHQSAPSWSPFRFAFNNPMRFSDPNGEFEIDEATAASYPKFNAYLKNISIAYANKPAEFKKAFKQYSELSDEQITEMLKYKLVKNGTPVTKGQKCPRIEVRDLSSMNANGVTEIEISKSPEGRTVTSIPSGVIQIDKSVVDFYEKNYFNPLEILDEEKAIMSEASEILLESTTFHEATHYGDAQNGILNQTGEKNIPEGGKKFEADAYGRDIGNNDGVEAIKVPGYGKILRPFDKFHDAVKYIEEKRETK